MVLLVMVVVVVLLVLVVVVLLLLMPMVLLILMEAVVLPALILSETQTMPRTLGTRQTGDQPPNWRSTAPSSSPRVRRSPPPKARATLRK